jgi:hypothetical protein
MIALRDDGGDRRPPSLPVATERATVDEARAGAVVCAACDHVVTHESARIDVDGAHRHVRTNPHGFSYEFGCFSEAPGTAPAGAPSMQATWFAGHYWWIRVCAACATHLGWLFYPADRTDGAFYGLILARLRTVYNIGR